MKTFKIYTLIGAAGLVGLLIGAAGIFAFLRWDSEKKTPIPENQQPKLKLVRIATLEGREINEEFQYNMNVINNEKLRIFELQQALQQVPDPIERAKLQATLEQATQRLNENNRKMIEVYGVSANRDYVYAIEKSQIYMLVNEDT